MRMDAKDLSSGKHEPSGKFSQIVARGAPVKLAAVLALTILMPLLAAADSETEAELLRAVSLNDCAEVETQLEAGASANMTFENFMHGTQMPILFMATSGSACIVEALIRYDADVNIVLSMPYNNPDKPLLSPLAAAIGIGNIPVVEVLLSSGAQTQLLDSRGHDLIPVYIDGLNSWIEPKRSPGTIAQITELLEQAKKK